jgi:hypothetical protein
LQLFDSLSGVEQQATMKEVQPYAGPMMISAIQAANVLNQAITISLPTDEDWRQAVAKDHDLSRIVQALKEGPLNSLTKAELVEKAYFEEWKEERLVVDDGIVCWTNMRTGTKRTQGTENPDAFIRLNMRIVRVAHFSSITQVERQLCIVNQGYTIVTKQQ